MTLDLTGDIAKAVQGAAERGHTFVIGYVDADGYPSTSYRGSTTVLGPTQLAVWARNPDEGLAPAVAERPKVTLLYFENEGPGPRFLSIRGRATVAPEANEQVYGSMWGVERDLDPERKGVAVVIDVESVKGANADGFFAVEA